MFRSGILFIVVCAILSLSIRGDFGQSWRKMQDDYRVLNLSLKKCVLPNFVQPGWKSAQQQIASIISGPAKENFLFISPIYGLITKSSCTHPNHKLLYLDHCISQNSKHLLSQFQDTTLGGNTIQDFGYSYDGLEQLYFFPEC